MLNLHIPRLKVEELIPLPFGLHMDLLIFIETD